MRKLKIIKEIEEIRRDQEQVGGKIDRLIWKIQRIYSDKLAKERSQFEVSIEEFEEL